MPVITLSCSPDADDLFMVRALLEGQIDTGPYRFEIGMSPTDALNGLAAGEAAPDVIALSVAHYPAVAGRFQLLPHGGSLGEGYGPVVVGRRPAPISALRGARIGIPGSTTTAWLVLRLLIGSDQPAEPVTISIVPHAAIFDAVKEGRVDYGLVIHEGRLTYEEHGMHSIVDIGEWWSTQTDGLPLPLGANAIRRGLGDEVIRDVSSLYRRSIQHALTHRDDAIAWLLARAGPLKTAEQVSEYLAMYANQRTLDYGPAGVRGLRVLFERAVAAGLLAQMPPLDLAP